MAFRGRETLGSRGPVHFQLTAISIEIALDAGAGDESMFRREIIAGDRTKR
jgi:hypothetical protein